MFNSFLLSSALVPLALCGTSPNASASSTPFGQLQGYSDVSQAVAFESDTSPLVPSMSLSLFYKPPIEEIIAFLSDEDDFDYSSFVDRINEFIHYGEIELFCSYFVEHRNDKEIYLFINGILETDIDIFSQPWYRNMLETISRSDNRLGFLRHSATVILREYF